MGVGHVPSGSIPRARKGSDLPRRERRRTGTARTLAVDHRPDLGRLGEQLAARFLESRGLTLLAHNVTVGSGELDLLMADGRERVVVEVRTRIGGGDPVDAIDSRKRLKVRRLASAVHAGRIDFLGIRVSSDAADIHWVPG